ncbi:MAG: universal stress protein [Gammaproteobacteria bacterium]|nr:universal stress protein [Gammaproteobacteria bacterium]
MLRNVERSDQGYRILEKLGEKVLETGAADARGKGIEAPVTALLRGDPADEIVRYVERVGADTVVSGSRGLGKLRGLVLGSVSQKLAQHAPAPASWFGRTCPYNGCWSLRLLRHSHDQLIFDSLCWRPSTAVNGRSRWPV